MDTNSGEQNSKCEVDAEDTVDNRKSNGGSAFTILFADQKPQQDSLQNAFKNYLASRKKEIHKSKGSKPRSKRYRGYLPMTDPNRMNKLRIKFLQQAYKYTGVPYAKKYWTPEDPEYASPLFLDCCGLIRRVMWDLKRDFGFRIGPWNQAYMNDILPIDMAEENMKPGDLVFIEGVYYNPKSKQQKHNIVHVEIWLGDGEKTLGARWQKGHVKEFDSYRFVSTSYDIKRFIYKSIDTWLAGICRSYCPEHKWSLRKLYNPNRYSIFNDPVQLQKKRRRNRPKKQRLGNQKQKVFFQSNEEDKGDSSAGAKGIKIRRAGDESVNDSDKDDDQYDEYQEDGEDSGSENLDDCSAGDTDTELVVSEVPDAGDKVAKIYEELVHEGVIGSENSEEEEDVSDSS